MLKSRKPTPDELLARIQHEERTSRHPGWGRLKIFLGYAPGVGKTYMMLSEAHRRKEREVDVVIGVVETHGRHATAELIKGLEVIPRKKIEYRGAVFEEMDLDAVIARRPDWAVVDEIAHTNVPGSKNEKRWQDIEEILQHGINVLTTLNVQHLESLNDAVYTITGVRVRETIPDRIVHEADEILDVDVTVRTLMNRLKRGEVYAAEKAQAAMDNFFREDRLTALREICLQEALERTDEDLYKLRPLYEPEQQVAVQEKVMICIPPTTQAFHLLRRGYRICQRQHAQVVAVCVRTAPFSPLQQQAFAQAVQLAHRLDIAVVCFNADNIATALSEYAIQNNMTQVVVGHKPLTPVNILFRRPVLHKLIQTLSDVDIVVVGAHSEDIEQA